MNIRKYITIVLMFFLSGCTSSKTILDATTAENLAYQYLFNESTGVYYQVKDAILIAIIGISLVRIGYRILFPEASMENDRGISIQTIMFDIGKILIAITLWYSLPQIFKTLMKVD